MYTLWNSYIMFASIYIFEVFNRLHIIIIDNQ